MSPDQPHLYPRRILLAVTGLAPQILTETLYALAVAGQPPFIPDEIHLVTTAEDADYARHTLLDSGMGKFQALLADYGLERCCRLAAEHLHVIRDPDGQALADIQTPEENLLAANTITDLVRRLTRDDDTAVHVSIAGGRKTMGFFMGYALSLYGRPQDRLSHVLVSPPFESNHEFYYPPPEPRVLFDRNNKPINTADARIVLADIPFVRLRQGLPTELIEGEASFGAAIAAAQSTLEPPRLRFTPDRRRLLCGAREVTMPPIVLAFYLWLAERRRRGQPPVRHTEADPEEFLVVYARLVGHDAADYERTAAELADGMEKEFFEQKKSLANAALKKALGAAAQPYLIRAYGKRPQTRHALGLTAEDILLT